MTSLLRIELPLGQLGRLTGQTETLPPIDGERSEAGRSLDVPMVAAEIGDPVPIVFCRWRGDLPEGQRGGVMIAPPATDGSFSNDAAGAVTARYQLLLSEGRLGLVQVRDVFLGGSRAGAFTQAYNRRAGEWGPGYAMAPWAGNPAPDAPVFVGTGQGRFDDVTMGAFTVTRAAGDDSWRRQVHLFIREGMEVDRLIEGTRGPSDCLADLVVWALLRTGRVSAQLVDGAAMLEAAEFLDANGLRFDGEITSRAGLLDWLTEVLPHYLVRLVRSRGIYRVRPLLPTVEGGDINVEQIAWSRTFTTADIDIPSLRLSTIPSADRRPVALLVKWRQQLEDSEAFIRTTTVRYGGSALGGPYEQVDLSAYCTSAQHAVTYGAFRLARRRYVEHRLTFRLRPSADSEVMAEGDIVRVVLEATNADTGVVRIDQLYTVEQISRSPAGVATLELLHFPVDDQGRSLIALDTAAAQALPVDLPLFSGRRGPVFDENSGMDVSVLPDLGPWAGWDPPLLPEALYPVGDEWPDGVTTPGFQPVGLEPLSPISTLNPSPVLPTAIPPVGDGWGAGRIAAGDIGELAFVEEEAYVAAVSFGPARLSYPSTFYGIALGFSVGLAVEVSVDNAPIETALTLVVTDGTGAWPVRIEPGKTTGALPAEATTGTATVDAALDRTLSVLAFGGGGYSDPEGGDLVTWTDGSFTVQNYEASITLSGPGLWSFDAGAGGWVLLEESETDAWTWDAELQQWQWNNPDEITDWAWDGANNRWTFAGTSTQWEWMVVEQRWRRVIAEVDEWRYGASGWIYTGFTEPTPEEPEAIEEQPAPPPAGPLSLPSPSYLAPVGSYTVTVTATLDRPAIGVSPDDDLLINLSDYLGADGGAPPYTSVVDAATPLVIPAISMQFGLWRWVPAVNWWQHPGTLAWRWDSAGNEWVYVGGDEDDWVWNTNRDLWEGGTGMSPSPPPQAYGSSWPPDAERWSYIGGVWLPPEDNQMTPGGTAPVFHRLLLSRHHTYGVAL